MTALAAGVGSAQIGTITGPPYGPLKCTASGSTPEQWPEGYSGLLGDIVITCTGGPDLPVGAAIPTVNVTIYLQPSVPVTSRIVGPNGASEAMLTIDEPGSGLPTGATGGYGPEAPQLLCTAAQQKDVGGSVCQAVVGTDTSGNYKVAVLPNTSTPAPNVFQGTVGDFGSNTVTFYNVIALPPANQGVSRVFRITDIRVQAPGGILAGMVDVFVLPSPAQNLPVAGGPVTVGFVTPAMQASMDTSPAGGGSRVIAGGRRLASTAAASACDVNDDGTVDIRDVQAILQQALGTAAPGGLVAPDGSVNVVPIQTVINAVLFLDCVPPVSSRKAVNMMIVVDRSASVALENAESAIETALATFVANPTTSSLLDGVDTVGLVSFGGTWRLDFAPQTHFQTGTPNIGTAIAYIPFQLSFTNTAEGLYQAWEQLYQLNQPGALNAIVLLTDGRPSAFTAYFTPSSSSSCTTETQRAGVFGTDMALGSYPFWPPPTGPNASLGIFTPEYQGMPEYDYLSPPDANCAYAANSANVGADFNNSFPASVGPVDNVGTNFVPYFTTPGTGLSTQSGYYTQACTNMNDPRCGRYAAINAADNMATLIRQDSTLAPTLFVIGLNYSNTFVEPLDEDWLARVANDPSYVTVGSDPNGVAAGLSVYQSGQTPGMYCNSTLSTLSTCFAQVASALQRLIR